MPKTMVRKRFYKKHQPPPETVKEMFTRLHISNDSEAMHFLVDYYQPFVIGFAASAMKNGQIPTAMGFDDLVQELNVELIKLFDRYDPGKGAKFETFATSRLKNEVIDCQRNETSKSRLGMRIMRQIRLSEDAFIVDHGRRATIQELSNLTKLSEETILLAMKEDYERGEIYSLDNYFTSYGAGTDELDPKDTLVEPRDGYSPIDDRPMLSQACQKLPPKEKIVISLYYCEMLTIKVCPIPDILDTRGRELYTLP